MQAKGQIRPIKVRQVVSAPPVDRFLSQGYAIQRRQVGLEPQLSAGAAERCICLHNGRANGRMTLDRT